MAMLRLAIATRVGHGYAEHAVHADYVQMREYAWRGVACLALLSILSAQNIIFAHPTWFYPSSGRKNKSQKSQYIGQKKLILFLLLIRFMRIDAHQQI